MFARAKLLWNTYFGWNGHYITVSTREHNRHAADVLQLQSQIQAARDGIHVDMTRKQRYQFAWLHYGDTATDNLALRTFKFLGFVFTRALGSTYKWKKDKDGIVAKIIASAKEKDEKLRPERFAAMNEHIARNPMRMESVGDTIRKAIAEARKNDTTPKS